MFPRLTLYIAGGSVGDGLTIGGLAGTITTFAAAPEPATALLALPALLGLGIVARRSLKG